MNNLEKTYDILTRNNRGAVIVFNGLPLDKSYVNPVTVPSLPNGKIIIPRNIYKVLDDFRRINVQCGKEVSYYLVGYDRRREGKPNEVVISTIIYSNSESATGSNEMCYFGTGMTNRLNQEIAALVGDPSVIVFQGHTHPNTAYSDNFSLLDLANVRESSSQGNFQYGGFLVYNGGVRAVFYDGGTDKFYRFESFETIQNQGLIIDADVGRTMSWPRE